VHHGLETLFKDLLFQRNPVFLLTENTNVKSILGYYQGFVTGQNQYLLDDAKTITPVETLERLRALDYLHKINERDYQNVIASFAALHALRNRLQHFALKIYPDQIIRVLGNLVPKSVLMLNGCYLARRAEEMGLRLIDLLPHTAFRQALAGSGDSPSIQADLNKIFPASTDVIAMLESKYDVLLNAAIKRFKKATFPDLPITLRLRDHGHVGAPPYMPEIELAGWINTKLSPHDNAKGGRVLWSREPVNALYEAKTVVHDPVITGQQTGSPGFTTSKLTIDVSALIQVLTPETCFNIPDAEDSLPYIKNPELNIRLTLECTSEGLFNDWHFDVSRVQALSGELRIELASAIFGDEPTVPSVRAVHTIPLSDANAAIRFHAFVESNRKLRDHFSLELSVEGKASLRFG